MSPHEHPRNLHALKTPSIEVIPMKAFTPLQRVRPSDGVVIALVISMFVVSGLAYRAVPSELLIHYTPPGGIYYGPETLSKTIGLFIIPIVSIVVFSVMRMLPVIDVINETLSPIRSYYQASIVLTIICLSLGQALLIGMNLLIA